MTDSQPQIPQLIHPRIIIRRALDILARRRARMVGFFLGTMALVVLGLLVCPRVYESEARMFVRVGKENIGIDPTATTGQTMALQESRENEITSILDILDSRIVLEGMVDQLGAGLILNGTTASGQSSDDPLLREKAIRHLRQTLETGHTKKSNVLTVTYRDRSPELARQILQVFVDQFQTVHIRANRTSGSFSFFEDQKKLLRSRFETASDELNEAKNTINAVSVDQRRISLQTHLSTVEAQMLTTQAELDSLNGSIAGLAGTLAQLPKKTLTQEVTGFPDDAVGATRKRVFELEIQERQLLTRFTARHPQVIDVRSQLKAARSLLEDDGNSGSQSTNADNPAYQQLKLRMLEQESVATGLKAKLASLQTQYAQIKGQLQNLNSQETTIAELQQRVDLLRNKYNAYSEKFEQARIDRALETEKISNVNVVQPPSYVAKAVSPRKGLTLILAFLFGVVGSVCLALLSEYWDACGSPQPVPPAASAGADPAAVPAGDVVSSVSTVERLVESAGY